MLETNGPRLWDSLMAMAEIGATANGGSSRLALTAEDAAGRALFVRWAEAEGLSVSRDAIGNLFARRAGQADGPPVVIGSHLDTQPKGGRFDGVLGVLAALEAVRTLNENNIQTRAPIEIANWTNEEGARFTPAMLGSSVFTGALALDDGLAREDTHGERIADSLQIIGEAGDTPLARPFDAYFEAHIEQGPVLEDNDKTIGVVTGGQAIRWLDVHLTGKAGHAGTTPMPVRRDAMFAAAEAMAAIEDHVAGVDGLLATIGECHVDHGSRNTIAADVAFTLDLRHPADAVVDAAIDRIRERLAERLPTRGVEHELSLHWRSPALPFDDTCVGHVRDAAKALGCAWQDIISGAGHDAFHLARHCPTAMVFIPCADGLSHHEAESIEPEHAKRAADVLVNAALARAGRV
ncbi:Zn-dependent hydrolase [Salinisphaera sp. C84B14]|uniref:Zn-dependent hydrolase n=1 Tax=unclassified Salinisphaera TaxID=2649847 RepID=UPI000C36C5DE|nr:Zn-dependent hydrolase [Salinisphaera sp.]